MVPQAYTSQFIALVMVALYLGDDRISTLARRRLIIDDLKTLPGAFLERVFLERMPCLGCTVSDWAWFRGARAGVVPDKITQVLKLDGELRALVENRLTKERSLLLLGRGYQHATCKEGALVRWCGSEQRRGNSGGRRQRRAGQRVPGACR